jgi:hypothetical protein
MTLVLASALSEIEEKLRQTIEGQTEQIVAMVAELLSQNISPTMTLDFENRLQDTLREIGRTITEFTYNAAQPEDSKQLPHDVRHEGGGYRRLNKKTANRHVATLFGKITLHRYGYRYWHHSREAVIFPLEFQLGLVEGATPAVAGEAARMMAETGATQKTVLDRLRRQFGVGWGEKKLRDLTKAISESMDRFRRHFQVRKLRDLLEKAYASKGNRKVVLSVGRDGISLGIKWSKSFEMGSTATITVYDRKGKRLGTVYLGYAPESKQQTMTDELTSVIQEVLKDWKKAPPRLCYVTDAGDNETQYYRKVLCRMSDPQRPGKRLRWYRIIDYYHTTEKITIMAEAVFGPGQKATTWARKARKLLLKPGGPSRVLYSAAAIRSYHGLRSWQVEEFERAYNYIRSRTRHMQYHRYRALGLPIGSGITEAACKTVYTQRLKLSGMRWGHAGAQVILSLRMILLSGIWDDVYRAMVDSRTYEIGPYVIDARPSLPNAA